MKKNITINLSGRLFNIDEDAYQLLKHYTDTLRRYYGKHEGDTEIADDIEARIAELFEEIKANGEEAITIEHVQGVISRIGELEDLAPEEETSNEQQAEEAGESIGHRFRENVENGARSAMNTLRSGKRFYRDMQNKMVCGVLAGCAQYFGGSPLAWRIGYIASYAFLRMFTKLFHMNIDVLPIFILGYFAFAILAPKAENPEDVLQMKGEEVTPQNIGEEVKKQNERSGSMRSNFLGLAVTIVLGGIAVFLTVSTIVGLCFGAVFFANPIGVLADYIGFENISDARVVFQAVTIPIIVGCAAAVGVCLILLYCVFHALASHLGHIAAMGFKQRIAWFLLLIVGVVTVVFSCAKFGSTCGDYQRKFHKEWREKNNVELVTDGYHISDENRDSQSNEGRQIYQGETDLETMSPREMDNDIEAN